LNDAERLKLNHIRGFTYMNLFAFVEEYIISQTFRHAQDALSRDHDAARALLRFAEEEMKHQKLFKKYCETFHVAFPTHVGGLEDAAAVAGVILSHSPIAVMLVTLHLELMTQQHFVTCVKDDETLDPLFTNILKHHWIEEAQHAKLDLLELEQLVSEASPAAVEKAVEEYFGILVAFDGLLAKQVGMDLESVQAATGRQFTEAEAREIRDAQLRSYRMDFLTTGMTNPTFATVMAGLAPSVRERLERETQKYSN
jgi:hypothetical protein